MTDGGQPLRNGLSEEFADHEKCAEWIRVLLPFFLRGGVQRQTAEDLTSDTLARAWANRRTFDPKKSRTGLRGWLFKIALNQLRTHYRNNTKRPPIQSLESDPASATETSESPNDLRGIKLELLMEALPTLPAEVRQIIDLHFGERLTLTEIAKRRGISRGALYRLLERHYKRLACTIRAKVGEMRLSAP